VDINVACHAMLDINAPRPDHVTLLDTHFILLCPLFASRLIATALLPEFLFFLIGGHFGPNTSDLELCYPLHCHYQRAN
jgi:hypothetical protein